MKTEATTQLSEQDVAERLKQIRERRNALQLRHGDWPCQTVHNSRERAFQQYVLEDVDFLLSLIDNRAAEHERVLGLIRQEIRTRESDCKDAIEYAEDERDRAATQMRNKCVEKVKAMGEQWRQEASKAGRMFSDKTAIAAKIATELKLDMFMNDIRGLLAHYRIADWEAYLFFRKPDCPQSYVLKYEATAGDEFAQRVVALHAAVDAVQVERARITDLCLTRAAEYKQARDNAYEAVPTCDAVGENEIRQHAVEKLAAEIAAAPASPSPAEPPCPFDPGSENYWPADSPDVKKCPACGVGRLNFHCGDYGTGVFAPDGYQETAWEEFFRCNRCQETFES